MCGPVANEVPQRQYAFLNMATRLVFVVFGAKKVRIPIPIQGAVVYDALEAVAALKGIPPTDLSVEPPFDSAQPFPPGDDVAITITLDSEQKAEVKRGRSKGDPTRALPLALLKAELLKHLRVGIPISDQDASKVAVVIANVTKQLEDALLSKTGDEKVIKAWLKKNGVRQELRWMLGTYL